MIQGHPNTSSLQSRVDALLSNTRCEPETRRQLYLLPPGVLSGVKRANQSVEDYINAVPISEALRLLTASQKIGALIQTAGMAKGFSILGLADEELLVEQGLVLQKEIADLVDGVVSVHQLNAYRMLRMRLFAALSRCIVTDDNCKVLLEMRKQTVSMLNLVDILIYREDQQSSKVIAHGIDDLIGSFKAYQERASGFNAQLRKDVELILQILQIIKRTTARPDHFLPLLLKPVEFQPLLICDKAPIYDCTGMSMQKTKELMQEFLVAWRLQTEGFFLIFREVLNGQKKGNESKQRIEPFESGFQKLFKKFQDHFKQAEAAVEGLANFEKLPLDGQKRQRSKREALEKSCDALCQSFHRLVVEDYQPFKETLLQFIDQCTGTYKGPNPLFQRIKNFPALLRDQFDFAIHFPFHSLQSLHNGVMTTILRSCQMNESYHVMIEKVVEPRFRPLNSVLLVDLLDFSVQKTYREWLESCPKPDAEILFLQAHFESIFIDMRRYYVQRKQLRGRSTKDLKIDSACIYCAYEAAKKAKELRQHTTDPKQSKLLELYENLGNSLHLLLNKEEWPKLLLSSLFLSPQNDPVLERTFHSELFSHLRHRFLTLDPQLLYQKWLASQFSSDETGLIDDVRSSLKQMIGIIQQYRRRLNAPECKVKTFLDEVAQCAADIEEVSEPLEISMHAYVTGNPQCSANLKKFAIALPELRDCILASILSSAKPLNQFLLVEELTAQEPAKTVKRVPKARFTPKTPIVEKTVQPPTAKAPAKETTSVVKNLNDGLAIFKECVQHLISCNSGFEATSADAVANVSRLNEWSSTLKENLVSLEEVIEGFEIHGNSPSFVAAVYLKMGVALEMIGKLIALNQHIPFTSIEKENELLHGRDYYWKEHSPYLYFKEIVLNILRTSGKMILKKEELAHLQKFDRVVSISSRYPASGYDELSEKLQSLFKDEHIQDKVKETILGAFQASICLMQKTMASQKTSPEKPLDVKSIPQALTTLVPLQPKSQEDWEREVANAVSSFEERLHRIQRYRRIGLNGKVPYIDEEDQTTRHREGTIHGALKDLKVTLQLADSLLLHDNDPSLCMTLGEESLLRQSVLLEQVLLILLSHLPIAAPRSNLHCLWEGGDQRPLRYRHHIQTLARLASNNLNGLRIPPQVDPVSLVEKTQEKSTILTPFLQQLYRYSLPIQCEARRLQEKFKTLSQLRSKAAAGQLSVEEQKELSRYIQGCNPEELLSNLDRQIVHVIREQIKKPLLEMLRLADQWLDIYEQQLKET